MMHAWAQVEEQERSLETFERDVAMQAQKIEEATAHAEDVSGVYEGHNQSYESAVNNLESLKTNIDDIESHWKEEKAAFDAIFEMRSGSALGIGSIPLPAFRYASAASKHHAQQSQSITLNTRHHHYQHRRRQIHLRHSLRLSTVANQIIAQSRRLPASANSSPLTVVIVAA